MKHPNIMIGKQGRARRNRGRGILNWKYMQKIFDSHKEHIYRIRKNQVRLMALRARLEAR